MSSPDVITGKHADRFGELVNPVLNGFLLNGPGSLDAGLERIALEKTASSEVGVKELIEMPALCAANLGWNEHLLPRGIEIGRRADTPPARQGQSPRAVRSRARHAARSLIQWRRAELDAAFISIPPSPTV